MYIEESYLDQKSFKDKQTAFLLKHLDLSQATISNWRHRNKLQVCKYLIQSDSDAKWLTVGDGRLGSDAKMLQDFGAKNVTASDLSEISLQAGLEKGYITKYQVANAEKLPFEDNEFDYVVCKEVIHHLPRPYLGIYESLRVAKKAVILIEPNDKNISIQKENERIISNVFSSLKSLIKDILAIPRYRYHAFIEPRYEESGNFLYGLSHYEMEKLAYAMKIPIFGYKPGVDLYDAQFEGVLEGSEDYSQFQEKHTARLQELEKTGRYDYLTYVFGKALSEEVVQMMSQQNIKTIRTV